VADQELAVEIREHSGKGVARKLRAAGRIPGIFYGPGVPSVSITLDPHGLRRQLERSEAGMNTLFDLQAAGNSHLQGKVVLVKQLQRHPVSGAYLHVDLYAVDLTQTIEVSVPIHLTGKAMGVDLGGILDHNLRELELECLPRAIPREILVDVSDLGVGDSLHVRDLVLPEGVKLISDPDLSVLSVVAPAVEEAAPAEAAEVVVEGEAPAAAAEGAEAEGAGEAKGD
jgi:large subunit ribosomal protein L25